MLSMQRKRGEYLSPIPWMLIYFKDLFVGVGEIWTMLGVEGKLKSICGKLGLSLLSSQVGIPMKNCPTIYLLKHMERMKQYNLLGRGKTYGGSYGNYGEIAKRKYNDFQM